LIELATRTLLPELAAVRADVNCGDAADVAAWWQCAFSKAHTALLVFYQMGPLGENMSPDEVAAEVVELRAENERLRGEADDDKDTIIEELTERVEQLSRIIRESGPSRTNEENI